MNQILLILKYKLLTFLRISTKFDLQSILKNIGSSIVYIAFVIGAFLFSKKIIWFLISEIKIGLFLLHEFLSIVLFIFFVAVNIGNIIVSYSTLYKSSEVNYLFTKPIGPSKVFVIKFFDNFFYSSSTLLLILLSVFAGYSSFFKLSIWKLVSLILFNFIPFIFSAGLLGVIILMIIIKLASKFSIARVLYSIIALYLISILFFWKINSPMDLIRNVLEFYPLYDKDANLNQLLSPIVNYFPSKWFSESAFWLIKGNDNQALFFMFLQMSIAISLFFITIYLGKKWYLQTWLLNLKLSAEYVARKKNRVLFFSFSKQSNLKPETEAILKRDYWNFLREPSQWIHFLVLAILILIFISSVSGIRYVGLGNFYLQTGIYLSVFIFNLLLISTLSLRFVFPLISLEGEAFWKLKTAPINNSFLIKKKLVPYSVVILIIGIGLSYFTNYRFNFEIEFLAVLITIISAVSIVVINFCMGGLFANYKEKNPIRIASSQGASITFLVSIVYILFIVSQLFNPMSNYFLSKMIGRKFDFAQLLNPIVPILLVSSLLVLISFKVVNNSLKKDF